MKNSTMISTKLINFQKSNNSLYLFFGMLITSFIIQQTLFGLGFLKSSGIHVGDEGSYKIYIYSIFQLIGTALIIINLTLISRVNKKFIWASWVGNSMLLIYAFSLSIWFEVMRRFLFLILYQVQYIQWNKNDSSKQTNIGSANKLQWFISICVAILIIGILGYVFSSLGDGNPFHDRSPWLDSAQFTFAMLGVSMGVMKKKESQLFYLIGNILIMIMFLLLGEWTAGVSSFIFMIITGISTLNWYSEAKKHDSPLISK